MEGDATNETAKEADAIPSGDGVAVTDTAPAGIDDNGDDETRTVLAAVPAGEVASTPFDEGEGDAAAANKSAVVIYRYLFTALKLHNNTTIVLPRTPLNFLRF